MTIEESESVRHTAALVIGAGGSVFSPHLRAWDDTGGGERRGRISGSSVAVGCMTSEGLRKVKEMAVELPSEHPPTRWCSGNWTGFVWPFSRGMDEGHRVNPSEINYRANIYALKSLGVRRVISVSAVGSMKESIQPRGRGITGSVYRSHQKRRVSTFFEGGAVRLVAFGEPVLVRRG